MGKETLCDSVPRGRKSTAQECADPAKSIHAFGARGTLRRSNPLHVSCVSDVAEPEQKTKPRPRLATGEFALERRSSDQYSQTLMVRKR